MNRVSLAAVLAACALTAGAAPPAGEEGAIRVSDIAATVRFLASPELEGRASAERGGAVASAFIAARFAAIGWLPAGDATPAGPSFYQSLPAVTAEWDRAGTTLRMSATDGDARATVVEAASGALAIVPDRAETIEVEGASVFAGFGIRAPEYQHDDYAALDVRGKIVIVYSGEPEEQDADSRWNGKRPTRHAPVSVKRALAESLGAAALIVVPNPAGRAKKASDLASGPTGPAASTWMGLAGGKAPLPVAYLDHDLAERARAQSVRVSMRIAYRDRREVTLRNVVARLGVGRGFEGELVLVGAHWDHLGAPGGVLHPGADDNASGIAALLAAAESLARERPTSAREIVFAAWTGEESGRLGSSWFASHPPVPLARIATAINLDMLGRDNMGREAYRNVLQVIYSAGAPALRAIATEANQGIGFDLRFYPSLRFRPVSDHHTFAEAGVPIVYPFSGYHDDYHGAGDIPDRVSPERVARAARFLVRLVKNLASRKDAIRIDPAIREAPAPDPFETPYGG